MKQDYTLQEEMPMPDYSFPLKIANTLNVKKDNYSFGNHWHPQIELLYITSGEGVIECNSEPIHTQPGDIIVVNSNDLHQGRSLSDDWSYYCIITDTALLHSQSTDLCETKYIIPISQNRILFKNRIIHDSKVQNCIKDIIKEYETRSYGFELAIKASLYHLIVLLLRNHVETILTETEYNKRRRNLERINPILKYIESHFQEKISVENLASMANLSRFHFGRIFKDITDKTPNEYINYIRINKAESMLRYADMNVTEAALAAGFNDLNYFSRIYKKYKHICPSSIRKQ